MTGSKSPRIVIIGAGGYVFPLKLVRDILAFPALQGCEVVLYDVDRGRAQRTLEDTVSLIDRFGLRAQARATDVRREALAGADFAIVTFQVGGLEAYKLDVDIPRKFGIDQPVGDTAGPGGIFRGLRSIEALRPIVEDMKAVCPEALLLQYANPMAINCWATRLLGIKTVGLCHSVQHTSRLLARELEVPYQEVVFDCAGVNHTAWFTTFRRGDDDLLPRLRESMKRMHGPGGLGDDDYRDRLYETERVRTELMELTGYFHTESSHHASEYWPWFRKSPGDVHRYLPWRWDFYQVSLAHAKDPRNETVFQELEKGLVPSEEYGAYIVDSVVTNKPRVIYGNVENAGAISNLPLDACVEVACLVDANGVRPTLYGSLPSACAALNVVQINFHRLVVEAALAGDRDLVVAAAALDPLTGALLTLPRVRELVDRMFAAQARWLPSFGQSERNHFA